MFDFFSSNFKRRAFEKALKQVKKEGYNIELDDDSDVVAILPDISQDIASLNKSESLSKPKTEEKVLDINEALKLEDRKRPVANKSIISGEFTRQTKPQIYSKLFKDSSTFLNKTDSSPVEFLGSKSQLTEEEKLREFNRRIDQQIFEKLRKQSEEKALKEQQEKEKREKEEAERLKREQELAEIESAKQRAQLAEKEKQEAIAIANEERLKAQQAEAKRLEAEQQLLASKPKPKPKTTAKKRTRKRKYDADIVGGFDF